MAEHAGLIPIGQAARLLMISEERTFLRVIKAMCFFPFLGQLNGTATTQFN